MLALFLTSDIYTYTQARPKNPTPKNAQNNLQHLLQPVEYQISFPQTGVTKYLSRLFTFTSILEKENVAQIYIFFKIKNCF